MITHEELDQHVRRFSYKPGWKFKIIPSTSPAYDPSGCTLIVEYKAPDSENAANQIPIVGYESIRVPLEFMDLHTFNMVIFTQLIRRAEQHEMEEWLRYDGKRIVDPHPK